MHTLFLNFKQGFYIISGNNIIVIFYKKWRDGEMPELKHLFIQGLVLTLFMIFIFSGVYLMGVGSLIGYLILITGTIIFGFVFRKLASCK